MKTKKTKKKYRLVIIDDSNLNEIFTFKVTKIKIYSFFSLLIIILLFLVLCVLVYTPVKYIIPGYGSYKLREKYLELKEKTDSLELKMHNHANYIEMLKSTINKEEKRSSNEEK